MATKTILRALADEDTSTAVVETPQPVVKPESDEERRRRRAGIACFL